MTPLIAGLIAGGITGAFLTLCCHVVSGEKIIIPIAGFLCALAPAVYFGEAGGQLYVSIMLATLIVAMTLLGIVTGWLTRGPK
jgi:hypothetical protein